MLAQIRAHSNGKIALVLPHARLTTGSGCGRRCSVASLYLLLLALPRAFRRTNRRPAGSVSSAPSAASCSTRRVWDRPSGECLASAFRLRCTLSEPSFLAHKYPYVFTLMPHSLLLATVVVHVRARSSHVDSAGLGARIPQFPGSVTCGADAGFGIRR